MADNNQQQEKALTSLFARLEKEINVYCEYNNEMNIKLNQLINRDTQPVEECAIKNSALSDRQPTAMEYFNGLLYRICECNSEMRENINHLNKII
jgi:hypothetical protein